MDKVKKRTLPIWTNQAFKFFVAFVPLAYKANGISDEITIATLVVLGGQNWLFERYGLKHREITEQSKKGESQNDEAPKQPGL